RRSGARLLEEVAHARRADADEHLDEFRAVNRKERYARFARDGAREQRLTRARRTDQQHALGNVSAEACVALGILEKTDDFLQLFLRFVDAGDVVESRLGIGLDVDLGLALADR